ALEAARGGGVRARGGPGRRTWGDDARQHDDAVPAEDVQPARAFDIRVNQILLDRQRDLRVGLLGGQGAFVGRGFVTGSGDGRTTGEEDGEEPKRPIPHGEPPFGGTSAGSAWAPHFLAPSV